MCGGVCTAVGGAGVDLERIDMSRGVCVKDAVSCGTGESAVMGMSACGGRNVGGGVRTGSGGVGIGAGVAVVCVRIFNTLHGSGTGGA